MVFAWFVVCASDSACGLLATLYDQRSLLSGPTASVPISRGEHAIVQVRAGEEARNLLLACCQAIPTADHAIQHGREMRDQWRLMPLVSLQLAVHSAGYRNSSGYISR